MMTRTQLLKDAGLSPTSFCPPCWYAVKRLINHIFPLLEYSEWVNVEDRTPNDQEITLCRNRLGGVWVDQWYRGKNTDVDDTPVAWARFPESEWVPGDEVD